MPNPRVAPPARKPQPGEDFYPVADTEVTSKTEKLSVCVVNEEYYIKTPANSHDPIEADGGWEIVASDGCLYDAYWSDRIKAWAFRV